MKKPIVKPKPKVTASRKAKGRRRPSDGSAPILARLSIDASRGTPALASMIARVLLEAGATVSFSDPRCKMPEKGCNLQWLRVHIDRLTWVREEEAARWGRELNTKLSDAQRSDQRMVQNQ